LHYNLLGKKVVGNTLWTDVRFGMHDADKQLDVVQSAPSGTRYEESSADTAVVYALKAKFIEFERHLQCPIRNAV